jgi:hypothetical protein
MPGWLVFVLLVAGFAVGVGGTVAVMVAKQRRQRRLDISFRERNATKAVGEMPDVEDLIKVGLLARSLARSVVPCHSRSLVLRASLVRLDQVGSLWRHGRGEGASGGVFGSGSAAYGVEELRVDVDRRVQCAVAIEAV